MTIKHGKFYKDGVQVPIEHGNKEQIKIINRVENLSGKGELLRGHEQDELDEDNENIQYAFKCLCGKIIFKEYTYEQNNLLDGDTMKCPSCETAYSLEACEFSEFYLVVKMLKVKSIRPI